MAGGQREDESAYASRTANPPPTQKTVILKQGVLYQQQYYGVQAPNQQIVSAEKTFVQTPADVGREDIAGKEALQVTTQVKTE